MEQMTKKKTSALPKVLLIVLDILLMIGIAFGVAEIVHRNVKTDSAVENGLSAYELAVQYGYDGSVQDWLDSLTGKSAYDIAKESGYTGTEDEFSASLAAAAENGAVTMQSAAFSDQGELLITMSDGTVLNLGPAAGVDGSDGEGGQSGTSGSDGQSGASGSAGQTGAAGASGGLW